ncbi:MAG: hypothetical protein FWD61_16220 [Phycisphaerales bacterium]|nr:hypothetical protein [Phycisphaerales bacterium]
MRVRRSSLALVLSLAAVAAVPSWARADAAPSLGALAKMPVTEVTVFKDGHTFMLHSGKMPTDPATGNVTLDYLPSPVLGTFWSATNDKAAKLTAVTASQKRVAVTRTALTLRELLEANVGAIVRIREWPETTGVAGLEYVGTILPFPLRGVDELEAISAPNTAPKLPQKSSLLLLKTDTGTRTIDIGRIQEAVLPNEHKNTATDEELRNLLTLQIQWENNKPLPQADVSMMYLQKGIRWIPSYKVILDGNGSATVRLQATIINELYDLQDVSAHLVVGVPTFAFAGTTDPISFQQAMAKAFERTSVSLRNSTSNVMSNSNTYGVQTQGRSPDESVSDTSDLSSDFANGQKNEDLFIFNVEHLTLKKGDRIVMPINEFKIPYKDVYKLDIPATPPQEVWRQFDTQQQAEIARLAAAPKFMHVLRMANKSDAPLTTAPALVIRDDRVLAQAIMTYTPPASTLDLAITPAIDIAVKKNDKETKRTLKAETRDNNDYARIDMEGNIKITNHRHTKVDLEITRNLLGQANTADNDGKIELVNLLEDSTTTTFASDSDSGEFFQQNLPDWWNYFNGISRITWKTTLEPEKSIELKYTWHYYWR